MSEFLLLFNIILLLELVPSYKGKLNIHVPEPQYAYQLHNDPIP